ncbi:MAG: sulfatase-like hydrolase/transferase, partial [Proteobacteria bacterium]|nr:sulfatase-like hydrolase/transferase [Pseudomonadota bacterium]
MRNRTRRILLAACALAVAACGGDPPGPPSIVLVTLDTTRADRLSTYGYERPTSPNLDALAREGVRYDRAYSVSSWTLPAHASLFTGKFPASHGVRHDPEGPLILAEAIPAAPEGVRARGMSAAEIPLAERLGHAGYATGGVVAGPWLMRPFGFDRGFDFYDDSE